jgi:hypothetical protein
MRLTSRDDRRAMTAVLSHTGHLVDQPITSSWPAELQLLLGDESGAIVASAVEAVGATLDRWSPRQVTYRPGSTTVQYRAEATWPSGSRTVETVVAATGGRIPPGADVLTDGVVDVAVWRWPVDPALPGLPAALDRRRVDVLLDDLGLGPTTGPLRVRAYRPGRRAVVEATARRGRAFLKVVRPSAVADLHQVHCELSATLPVPRSCGWSADGIVVLAGMPGRTMREVLRTAELELPSPAAVEDLLDRLPGSLSTRPARRDLLASARFHGEVVAATLPTVRGQVEGVLDRLRALPPGAHDLVPVHGDLYEAQLLVRNGRLSGLLDVDTAGPGHRIDDLANMIAHLSVLGLVSDRPKPVHRYGARFLAHAERRFDRTQVRTRVAAGVLGLATGPFRVLETNWPEATRRRVELATQWLDGART